MASESARIRRRAARAVSMVAGLGLLVAANGCFNDAEQGSADAGFSGTGGSPVTGSGGSTVSGSGGSIVSGSGGSIVSGSGGSPVPDSGGAGPEADAGAGGTNGGADAGSGIDGTVDGTGGIGVGPVVPLPLVVTDYFDNQGWFGDAQEMMAFMPGATIINQAAATTGPCAKRVANARGNCLKVVFTPPPNITPLAAEAYIGVFLLTTDKANHPTATPPEVIGQANWGASEPGINIAPGATKIAFQLAGDVAGKKVSFKAGAGPDKFQLPEMVLTTKTTWQAGALSLTGQDYGMNVVGAFAWVLTDTTKATTFYLDDIVWTM